MSQSETETVRDIRSDYGYGWHVDDVSTIYKAPKGLTHELLDVISDHKSEPDWMRKFRHQSLDYFIARPMPGWGADLSGIDFDNIHYYLKPTEKQVDKWEDLPAEILDTWDRLGIPEAEKKYLAGVGAQYESEVVYHKLQADLETKGVIFLDMDSGLREHEELVKQYFATIIPQNDNKFAALNSAVWSGGSFIYVPPGVSIEMPLQAYFRINAENMGQFERTLIIVDEGAYVHYVEGCTAPIYSSDSLHSAVVEIVVKKGGRCRYTTIQNWSNNVYNLVTKRAVAYEDATMEWVDGNLGSKVTMKYPAIWLMGERAHGEVLSIAFAGKGQHQDAGGKVVHVAKRHDERHHVEVDLEERRARRVPRPARGGEGRDRLEVEGRLRRADPRRGLALRHLSVHRREGERRRPRPRGDRLQDRRGAALLPHEPRALGSGGERDDRLGLRRADHEGAPARVRRRDEPPHPVADGRLCWLGRSLQADCDASGSRRAEEERHGDHEGRFRCRALDRLEALRAFYVDTLGLRPDETGGAEFWSATSASASTSRTTFGLEFVPQTTAHLALHVDDVATARAELEGKGIEFDGDTFDTGVCHMAFFHDPDGNALMLHHRYKPREQLSSSSAIRRCRSRRRGTSTGASPTSRASIPTLDRGDGGSGGRPVASRPRRRRLGHDRRVGHLGVGLQPDTCSPLRGAHGRPPAARQPREAGRQVPRAQRRGVGARAPRPRPGRGGAREAALPPRCQLGAGWLALLARARRGRARLALHGRTGADLRRSRARGLCERRRRGDRPRRRQGGDRERAAPLSKTWLFASCHARIERDAELDWVEGGFGSAKGKTWIQNDLADRGASSRVTGAYFADGSQHLDYDTYQLHAAPDTTSDFAFKGALRDKAATVWRGMIRVEEGAQKTNAYQENRNLLLSKTATANSIPGLEILANDVRCTHGATLSQVDREQLFYLMARGLPRAEAERLIVRGFFQDVLDRIELEPVREALGAALEARIPQG